MIDRKAEPDSRPITIASDLDRVPPHARLRASVILPARNEVDHLAETLRALAHQTELRGGPLDPHSFEVILLANNCTDGTAALARQFARSYAGQLTLHVVEHDFPADQAHVGTARRWLMDQACERLDAVGQPRGLIASTDADSQVAGDWVAAGLHEVAAGADAVAGLIRVNHAELRQAGPEISRRYCEDLIYRRLKLELAARIDINPLDPTPGHDFHGGANLGITPTTYRAVGRLPPLPCLEDVALTAACWRADARFVHSSRLRVRTSARLRGRTAGGLSQALAGWAAPDGPLVPDAHQVETELIARHRLRRFFRAKNQASGSDWHPDTAEVARLALLFHCDAPRLIEIMRTRETFGWWLHDLEPFQKSQSRLVSQAVAVDQLRSILRRTGVGSLGSLG